MKNLDKEYLQEIERFNEGRSLCKAKYLKCERCGEIQIVNDVQCPECGSYDLTEVYLSAQDLEQLE